MGQITQFVPADRRAIILPGVPADRTYTFGVRAFRRVHKDISSSGVLMSSTAMSTPYKPTVTPAFNGNITGTIQGRNSLSVVQNLEAIASDTVLSTTEKPGLVIEYNRSTDQLAKLVAKANMLGIAAVERDAANAAKTALDAYLNSLSPPWNDASQHSPIVPATFQARWASYYAAISDLDAAITGQPGPPGVNALSTFLTNEAHTVSAAQDGSGYSLVGSGGTFRVFDGTTDVTTSGTTFSVVAPATKNGLTISINAATGVYTLSGASWTSDSENFILRAVRSGVTIERTYAISKSRAGAQGPAGPALVLTADNQAFTFIDGLPSPVSQTITLSALLNNVSGTVVWSTTPSVTLGGTGNTRTLSVGDFGSNRQVTVQATVGGVTDRVTIVRLERDVFAGNANRVPFSRMEGNKGWAVTANPSGLAATTGYGTFENRRFFAANVTATAAGQNYNIGGGIRMRVTPGERLSVQAKLDVFSPAATGGNWVFRAVFFDAANAATLVNVATGSGAIAAPTITSGFIEVPAGQVSMILELAAFSGASGAWSIGISEPMVTSAAIGQTSHPTFTPGPNADDGADVSVFLSGPKSSTFTYTSTGVLDPSAQLPADFFYTLSNQAGLITSGVTWQYRILEGIVNTFSASATLRSMSVSSGVGTFTLSDLGSNTARVEIIGTWSSGQSISDIITLTKLFAAPNSGGGGGGGGPATATQTSGFASVSSSTFATVSNELQVTSTTTTQTVDVQLTFQPPPTGESSSTIEVQLERWNGSAWVAMGAAETRNSSTSFVQLGGGTWIRVPAVFNFQRTTTITAGSNQRTRVRARRSAGTVTHSTSGTLTLSA